MRYSSNQRNTHRSKKHSLVQNLSILDEPRPLVSRLPLDGLTQQKQSIFVANMDESSIEAFPETKTDESTIKVTDKPVESKEVHRKKKSSEY